MRVTALTALILVRPAVALAHAGPHPPVAAGLSAWDVATLTALCAAAIVYFVGSLRLRRSGGGVRAAETASFWSGWTAMVLAVSPWMDRAAALTFSSHMVQHELIMLVGAPLMIIGRPIVPWLWALPPRLRRPAGAAVGNRIGRALWLWATTPAVAWLLHGTAIWVWHLPALFEAAVEHEGLHVVQHATFAATAVCFWWGLVYGRYGRAAYGASALYVFTTMVHTGLLGALFALSTGPLYAVYRDRALLARVDAVADQQLAGLYMWIPAGIILTILGLALVVAWIAESERRATSGKRVAAALLPLLLIATSSCGRMPHEQEVRRATGGDPYRGRDRIRQYGCDSCHTIPGVLTADSLVGPPLTQIARRVYLAGHIENTPENMIRWIQHPRLYDEKTAMPEMGVTPADSRDIVAYLYTLR
jgi:putative membrane protein